MTSNATQGTGGHTGSIVAAGLQRTYRAHVPLSHNKTYLTLNIGFRFSENAFNPAWPSG